MYKILYNTKKKNVIDDIIDEETGEIITPKYNNLVGTREYIKSGVFPLEPMTAKEYLDENMLNDMLTSSNYYAEEKLDGVRGLLYINSKGSRLFSRNISKHTKYYMENSDSVPHLRDFNFKQEKLSVIDGECFIPNRTFKEVSSTLNCNWDLAIARQLEYGFIVLNTFDIIMYKGVYVAKLPLYKRKKLLYSLLKEMNCPYIRLVPYFTDKIRVDLKSIYDISNKIRANNFKDLYPTLYNETMKQGNELISKLAYYQYIVAKGGEGIMLKDKEGKYYHKRGREYTKYKKYITRECVLLDFSTPTKLYTGKELNNPKAYWDYYINDKDEPIVQHLTIGEAKKLGYVPSTKFYATKLVGNMILGVKVDQADIDKWKKVNKKEPTIIEKNNNKYLVTVECAGFDDTLRELMTKNIKDYNSGEVVVEILANEIFKKTGKLRHPRFLRFRNDKTPNMCTWNDYINC